MYCKNCGKEIETSVKFCPYCGKSTIQEYKDPKKDNKNKFLYIGTTILAVIAISLACVLLFGNKMGKSYDDYMDEGKNYITQQNYEAAKDKFLKAYEFDPKQPEAYIYLYQIYDILEEPEKKEDIETKAMKNLSEEDKTSFKEKIASYVSLTNIETTDLDIDLPDFDMTPIAYNDNGYIVRVNKKYGVIGTDGKWIIEADYDALVFSNYSDDEVPSRDTKIQYYLIKDVDTDKEMLSIDYYFGNSTEKTVTRSGNGRFHQEGLYVDDEGKIYYLENTESTDGKEVKDYDYEQADSYDLKYNITLNNEGNRYLLINKNLYGPYEDDEIMNISYKYNAFEKGDYGFWQMYGYVVNNRVHGLFYTKEDGKYRIYNVDTLQHTKAVFDEVKVLTDSQILVRQGRRIGVVGVDLSVKLASNQFDDVTYPIGDKAFVKKNKKWKVVQIGEIEKKTEESTTPALGEPYQSIIDGAKNYLVSQGCNEDLTLTGIYAGHSTVNYDNGIETYQIGFITASNKGYSVYYYTDLSSIDANTYKGGQMSHWVNGTCVSFPCDGWDNYTFTSAAEVNGAIVESRQAYLWDVVYELEPANQELFDSNR